MNRNPFSISGVKRTGVRTRCLFRSRHKCTPYTSPPPRKVTGSDHTHTQFPLLHSRSSTPDTCLAFHCLFSHCEVLVPAELIYVNIRTRGLAGDVTLPPLNPSGSSALLLKSQTCNDGDMQLTLDLFTQCGLCIFFIYFLLLLCSCLLWDLKLLNIYISIYIYMAFDIYIYIYGIFSI